MSVYNDPSAVIYSSCIIKKKAWYKCMLLQKEVIQ